MTNISSNLTINISNSSINLVYPSNLNTKFVYCKINSSNLLGQRLTFRCAI